MTKTGLERRRFIALFGAAGAASALTHRGVAQQEVNPSIGVLSSGKFDQALMDAFNQGLTQTGLVPGADVTVEFRWADDQYDRLPALAKDLASRKTGVIAAIGLASALAAKSAAARIPMVFVVEEDPVKFGLVTDPSLPSGNATGVSYSAGALTAIQFDLVGLLVKHAPSTGLLLNPNNSRIMLDLEAAGSTRGEKLVVVKAGQESELDAAFSSLSERGGKALVVPGDPFFFDHLAKLVALTAQYRLPTIYPAREFAAAGGLMSYGIGIADLDRKVGVYSGWIAKGAKPVEFPVQQDMKAEFVVNLHTANALDFTVPVSLLARADEVIE